jgi:RNA methyltransferase, TrmH family
VCVLEGLDLVEAALDTGQEFEGLFFDNDARDERLGDLRSRATQRGVRCFTLATGVIDRVADAQSPQPVLATVRFAPAQLDVIPSVGLTLILHDVRDPGNAGTVIRSGDAAGVDAVLMTGHCVDPYNPKTLRATAGSIFHVPVVVADLGAAVAELSRRGASTWAAVVRGGTPLTDAPLRGPCAVVVGNESEGLDEATIARCAGSLSIPMVGRSESLNLGVAASLIAFEAMRQSRIADGKPGRPSLGGS